MAQLVKNLPAMQETWVPSLCSLIAHLVKSLPATQETQVQFLGWEDPLGKEMATHSSALAWRIQGTGGAWWAAVYGIAQSRTRLNRLSSSSSSRLVFEYQGMRILGKISLEFYLLQTVSIALLFHIYILPNYEIF